eukprot:Sspe_Gene.107753::Locus_86188_Transcript_1_1_Confidence_1.000_Length_1249::g.107753::m.107753
MEKRQAGPVRVHDEGYEPSSRGLPNSYAMLVLVSSAQDEAREWLSGSDRFNMSDALLASADTAGGVAGGRRDSRLPISTVRRREPLTGPPPSSSNAVLDLLWCRVTTMQAMHSRTPIATPRMM